MFRSTKDPLTFSNISSSQCCSDPVPHRGVGVSHRTDPVFLYQVLLSRPARRFVQPVGLHNALSALWWNGNCPISRDLQYGEGGGGITVLISWMVFTPHCLKFLSLKPYQWVGLDMTGLSPRPSLQLSKDDVSIIRSHSMVPVDMYWHWLQIMLIPVQW